MNFFQAIESCFRNYVNFNGRAPRSEYWYWILFGIIVAIVAGLIDLFIFPDAQVGPIGGLTWLALLLPNLAVIVRRLHDLNQRGWWIFGSLFLWLAFAWKGTEGPNRFGPDPLAGDVLTPPR